MALVSVLCMLLLAQKGGWYVREQVCVPKLCYMRLTNIASPERALWQGAAKLS